MSPRAGFRIVLECASKAMVAVAVMLAVMILAANPALDTPARGLAATLLLLGSGGLLALRLTADRPSTEQVTHRR